MSFEAAKWAMDLDIPPGPKFVLVVIASYADDRNTAWPSFATISRKTSYPRRSIIRFVDYLIKHQLMSKIGETSYRSNVYQLNLSVKKAIPPDENIKTDSDTMSPCENEIVTPCHQDSDASSPDSDTMSPTIVTPCHPIYQSNNQSTIIEPSNTIPSSVEDGGKSPKKSKGSPKTRKQTSSSAIRFEDFWKEYPCKKEKKTAKEVWVSKELDKKADVLIEDVVKRKAQDSQWLSGYIPYAAKYLRREKWNDEMTPINKKQTTYTSSYQNRIETRSTVPDYQPEKKSLPDDYKEKGIQHVKQLKEMIRGG